MRSRSTEYGWKVVESSMGFSISQHAPPGLLHPGAPPAALPVELNNPNDVAISVTQLTVSVANSPEGCDPVENVSVTPSTASDATPVVIPAGASVTLPDQGVEAPTIQLLDLPVDQDACQNAEFQLDFSGEARG